MAGDPNRCRLTKTELIARVDETREAETRCIALIEELKRILRIFRDADACDPETGPYLDFDLLTDAYVALKEHGRGFIQQGTHDRYRTIFLSPKFARVTARALAEWLAIVEQETEADWENLDLDDPANWDPNDYPAVRAVMEKLEQAGNE